MTVERTFTGLEVCLGRTGSGRFFEAAFLVVWLTFWVIGELFVVWFLGAGAWALVTGSPPRPGGEVLAWGPSLAVGTFMVLWLCLWTVGGWTAIHQLLRTLAGEDRFRVTPSELEVSRKAGPWRNRRSFPREAIRRIFQLGNRASLHIETPEGSIELTRWGTPAQREEIQTLLRRELALTNTVGEKVPRLPAGWSEAISPEGDILLVRDPLSRRKQAYVAGLVGLLLSAATMLLARGTLTDLALLPLTLIVGIASGATLAGALWLGFGRTEWRIRPGRLARQRRFGSRVGSGLEVGCIHLVETKGSDGDDWYHVRLEHASAAVSDRSRRRDLTLVSRIHDDTEPRRLAEWLAHQSGLPLRDEIPTPEERTADRHRQLEQLKSSGRFGAWVARRIESRPRQDS